MALQRLTAHNEKNALPSQSRKKPLPGLKAAGEVEKSPDKQGGKVDKPDQACASEVVADCIRFKLFRIAVSVVLVSSR